MNTNHESRSGGTDQRPFFLMLGLSIVGLAGYLLGTRIIDFPEWDRFAWEIVIGITLGGAFLVFASAFARGRTLDRWTKSPGAGADRLLDRFDRGIPTPMALLRSLVSRHRV